MVRRKYMDPRKLVLNLERPYAAFSSQAETPRDVLLAGLKWRSDYWTGLAVAWIHQGAPIDEDVVNELELVSADKHLVQKTRQDAFVIAKKWRKGRNNSEPGAPP